MKTTFIYWAPHHLHKKWASSVTNDQHPFIFKSILEKVKILNPVIHQVLSIINAPFIPKSDIYLLEGITCILPAIIRKKKNGKIIMMNCDNFFKDVEVSRGIKRKIFLWYISKVDGIISNSEYVQKLSKKYTKVPNIIVYPGIEKKFFSSEANYNSNTLCHGLTQIRLQKGSDLVLTAFEKTKMKKLILIGTCKEDVKIPKNNNIVLTGWTNNPEKYLNECSIFVNPARMEPFGMNIVEAMAAGFAPIISENCGAKEIVARLDKKLIIKPTVPEIIKTIKWLNEGNRKETLGKKAKKIAKEYTIDKSIDNFKNTFKKIAREI